MEKATNIVAKASKQQDSYTLKSIEYKIGHKI